MTVCLRLSTISYNLCLCGDEGTCHPVQHWGSLMCLKYFLLDLVFQCYHHQTSTNINAKVSDVFSQEEQDRQTAFAHINQHCNTHTHTHTHPHTHTEKSKLSWGSHWRLRAHNDLARPCHKALDNNTHKAHPHTHTHTRDHFSIQ